MGKKDDEIENLRNQLANFSAQYNRLLERLKEVNTINKQWEKHYNDVKVNAERTIQEKEHERLRLMDDLSRAEAKVKFLEQELELAKERMEGIKKEVQEDKNKYAVVAVGEDIVIPRKSEVGGGLKTDANIKLGENVIVHADLEGNNISVGPASIVIGVIRTKGHVVVNRKCEIAGNIVAGGDVTVEPDCKLRKVIAGGKVTIGDKTKVDRISSSGGVELKQGVAVKDGVEYVGSLNIGEHVNIGGNIRRKQTTGKPVASEDAEPPPPPNDEEEEEEEDKEEGEEEYGEDGSSEEPPRTDRMKAGPPAGSAVQTGRDEGGDEGEEAPPSQDSGLACGKCGEPLSADDTNFCPNCGKSLVEERGKQMPKKSPRRKH